MNYFLTPDGLKPTGMSVPELFDYITIGELAIGRLEGIQLFKDVVHSSTVLFVPKEYHSVELQLDYNSSGTAGSAIRSMMRSIEKQVEKGRFTVVVKIENDEQMGDYMRSITIPEAHLAGVFRNQILDDLLPTL